MNCLHLALISLPVFFFSVSLVTKNYEDLFANGPGLPSCSNLPVQEMKKLNMFYIEQNAGDIMWIPAGVFHGVRNMTNTLALSYNILLADSFLDPEGPGLAHLTYPGTCRFTI